MESIIFSSFPMFIYIPFISGDRCQLMCDTQIFGNKLWSFDGSKGNKHMAMEGIEMAMVACV